MATRRKVLGDAHVDRADAAKSALDAPVQDLIVEAAWCHVWSRPELSLRERSLITIVLPAAAGHEAKLAMHVRATANTGASPLDIFETLMHVAIYAGVPAANSAIRIAREELRKMGVEA